MLRCLADSKVRGCPAPGNQTAQHHDKVARAWLKQRGIEVPGGLNYLEIDSAAGQEYLQARPVSRPGLAQGATCCRAHSGANLAEVSSHFQNHTPNTIYPKPFNLKP